MVQSAWLLMVLSLVLGPGRGNAEETFTFKIKASNKGDRSQVDKQATDQSTMQLEDSQGNTVQSKEETKAEKFVYQETILEKPAGQARAARLRRHYDVAEAKTGDDRRTLPYQGKTIVIEKKGDRYRFQVEGGEELTGKDAEHLDKEFNQQSDDFDFAKLMLPKKPVRVKESWKLDAEALIKNLEKGSQMEIDAAKTKATGKLLKAYKQDGHQFGIIELHLDFPIKAFTVGEMKTALAKATALVIDATLDTCIDGSLNSGTAKFRGRMEGQSELAQGDRKFKLTFTINRSGQYAEKEQTKK